MMHRDGILQDLSVPAVIHALEANINARIPLMYTHMPRAAGRWPKSRTTFTCHWCCA